ncbi:MAG: NifU family protein [Candidatus Calescibacterium sp.]|nr:NifU family protein [Candidatus Calescibacterium sp.]MCX7734145.1 NifU family protein [bacterium]
MLEDEIIQQLKEEQKKDIKLYKIEEDQNKIIFGLRTKSVDKSEIQKIIAQKTAKEVIILSDPFEEVEYVLNRKVIDYIKSHGGELKLVKVDQEKGEVVVSMSGACALCPSAVVTMKAGIRRILSQFIPWVKRVEPAEEPKEPDFGFKLAPKTT